MALTCLGNIAEGFLGKVGEHLFAPIQRQLKYTCCFNSNITELETQLKKLEKTKEEVQLRVNEELRNVRIIPPEVVNWLERADEVTPEVYGIIQDKAKVKEGWCPNLKLRYSLSRKAVKKTKVVVDLQVDDVMYIKLSYRPEPSCMGTIPNGDFTGFESRRLVMEEIIKALKNDEINLIGVWGMGGVGKTTLVNEVAKRVKEDNHFDEVAMAVVGQEPDLTNVQACIADMLGLKNFHDTKSLIVRADLLRRRLLRDNMKVLVILDDIWAEFDLQAMGIPLEGADKNFKMLYTSRTRDLWHDLPTKKQISLELLSEDEAWQLFREKAGDLVEARDLQPIAKQIMNKCDRLPLALVSIGRALSKTSGRNTTKKIWEGMLNRLTCATSTPADERLSSRLELSYKYLEDEEAKRLFLLCCLFQEDEDIRLEDLARYGFGLSLFDRMNQMGEVRHQVSLIVDDLKSRCLLLDSEEEKEECVKVHDVVRNMGISIASEDKFALVSHGAISQWPKTATHEHYNAISVISDEIEELPEALTYPNLEFLMLRCQELEKLPPNFLEGMGKLKVLELHSFCGILTLQSLRNLTTLSLEGFCGTLDNVSLIGGIPNLEILNFRYLMIEELPEEIGELVNLRLLDLRDTHSLTRVPPGIISRLVHLEELYFWGSKFIYWEGEGSEEEVRNANLREFEFLSNLNTLEICIRSDVLIPKVPIFGKLKIFKVAIGDGYYYFDECNDDIGFTNATDFFKKKCERVLWVEAWIPIPSDRGGIDSLLRSSDWLRLKGEGCNDLVWELLLREGVNGLQQLKVLEINRCDTPECLVNTKNLVHLPTAPAPAIFPILEDLHLCTLVNIREICRGPVPAHSFGELTSIRVNNCGRLGNLFQLPIEGYLTRLENLIIRSCDMMAEVFWKDQLEEVHVATNNRIVFPKLEVLVLEELPILMGFCRGIDQIDFPQLKQLELRHLRRFNRLFPDHCNLSSNSEQNDNVGFHSLFPQKVSFPNLVVLKVAMLENLERLGHGPLSVRSFSKLKECSVHFCGKLLCVFPSQLLSMLPELQGLTVESCDSLEVIFELKGLDSNEPNPEILSPLKFVKLRYLPKLNCISKRDPVGFKYIQTLEICDCNSLRYVFAPTMTKSIPQLRKLKILRCEMLARIVAVENGLGESSEDEVEFPQLESLELLDLPNLLSFFPNVNVNTTTLAKSSDHYRHPLQPQPLFNEKVVIPSLEYLKLEGLQNVSGLWSSELPTSSFYKLKKLEVRGCANLRSTFHPSMVEGLANLLELVIADCSKMEGVVYWEEEIEDGQGRKVDKTLFPQLRKLQLRSLPNLESFFPNVGIPSLEYLKLEGLQNVSDLWSSELPTSSFYKLKKLEVRGCANLRNVFHPSVAGRFLNLQELVINDCSKMEGVVDWVEEREERQGTKIDRTLYYRLIKLENLEIYDCNSLRCVFAPTMTKSIPQLRKLKILRCKMLSRIVAEENGLGESSVDEVEFPQLESLELLDLPNLLSFFPNVNVNTTTLAKSTDHNPLQPQPLFNEKVAIPNLEYLVPVGLQSVSDLWGSDLPTSSFSKLKNLQVTGCASLRNFPFILWIGDLNNTTQGLQKVAQLLYTNSKWEGDGVLALGSNGTMTLWKWGWSQHNPSGKATTSAFPQQYWQPASGLAMTDDVTGVNLEEAVPCMALSKNGSYIISAYGGEISLFNIMTWRVMRTFMPPPPASTFLAFYPQDSNIIAIGMEDSTIRIYNVWVDEVKSELKGHKKRITGLAFSTHLNILVSSGADAQLCIWNINTWEHLKSVPIQLPGGKTCNGDTRVQFHSDQIRLLVSHEAQLAIYDASEMDCIRQWVPQDVLPAPISFAAYSCDSQLVYTSFSDGNIGVFDAYSLTCRCHIAPSAYSRTLASGSQDVYPIVVAAHPQQPNQFAIGLTNGFVIVMELQESEGKWGLFPPEMGC